MLKALSESGFRLRVLSTRLLARLGLGDSSFLLLLSVVIGIITAIAALGFHELIVAVRDVLFRREGAALLYGPGIWLLIVIPALGGLCVGALSRYLFRTREGHGVTDVIESVIRTSGFQRPLIAIEKILTSAITLGTGGSAGAEGPIVQIGAAISSGVGQVFQIARHHMPILIGCGTAAGISSIFNAPFGGVLFTLEIILQDFSLRTITPVVLASVVAQVTTMAMFQFLAGVRHAGVEYKAIFAMPDWVVQQQMTLSWAHFINFVALGLLCGIVGVALTKSMQASDAAFRRLRVWPAARPAIGGMLLGCMGVAYVLVFGRLMLGQPKPFSFDVYPMPAFFGDGYGIVQRLLSHDFYAATTSTRDVLLLLTFLCVAKIIATSITLGSGGSGGIIAPSLFLGVTAGAVFGILLGRMGYFRDIQPELFALVAMGAVLAAVVHAPMASILIVFELTQDYKVMLPAMLACITATGMARLLYRDSIYTASLRRRGLRVGIRSDLQILRQLSVEQVELEPASVLQGSDPFQRCLDLIVQMGKSNFIVIDKQGRYVGMVVSNDINVALIERDAAPVMVVSELMRTDLPLLKNTDDLAAAMDAFSRYDVSHLPVVLSSAEDKVIGLITRAALLQRYQHAIAG